MKYLHRRVLGFLLVFLVGGWAACKSGGVSSTSALERLYGIWHVAYILTADKAADGAAMGYPQYEFTRDGKRIRTLNTTPPGPPETVAYAFDAQKKSISYPGTNLPEVAVLRLDKDSLVLKSEKAEWHLYRKP